MKKYFLVLASSLFLMSIFLNTSYANDIDEAEYYYDLSFKEDLGEEDGIESVEKSIYYLTKAIKLNPEMSKAYRVRGYLRFMLGNEEAIEDINTAVKLADKEEDLFAALNRRSVIYGQMLNDWEQGIKDTTKQIEMGNKNAYIIRALCKERAGDFIGARQDRVTAVSLGIPEKEVYE